MAPQPPSPAGTLGGMGGASLGARTNKSGLTFDHILGRLQSELMKSREVGAELSGLTNAMNDIQDTLGGSVVRSLPSQHQVFFADVSCQICFSTAGTTTTLPASAPSRPTRAPRRCCPSTSKQVPKPS